MSAFVSLFKKKKKENMERNLLGKRQEEHKVLKDGALLFQELIGSCDGKVCHPIRIFFANELMVDEVCPQIKNFYYQYTGTYQDRQIFIKLYGRFYMDLFINEVVSIAQINHRNVVKLLGCCFEMQSPIVVFELLPNTLYDLLRTENPSKQISWENRLRIATEIADAVTYLHIANPRPIIHRSITSSHILLDEHCRPKLCGFSLSIAIPLGKTHAVTNHIFCSQGYTDPNYVATGIVTEKVDVYSFGWLMLEILSQKDPYERAEKGEMVMERTLEKVLENVKRLSLISDADIPVDARKIEQSAAFVELAGRCIAREPNQRPTMKEVALKLRQIEKHQLPCCS